MNWFKGLLSVGALALGLAGCGGGGGSSGSPVFGGGSGGGGSGGGTGGGTAATPTMSVSLSSSTVTGAQPATVTATVTDGTFQNNPIPGVVVAFTTTSGLGSLSAASALTDAAGHAVVSLSPVGATASGADTVKASASVGSTQLTASAGFQLTATTVAFTSFTSDVGNSSDAALGPYAQAVLSLNMTGVSDTAPVTLSFTSACVSQGKASISPTTLTTTTGVVSLTYKDTGGCGATLATDTITASVNGASKSTNLKLFLTSPAANSINFIAANPPVIYLKGSGYQESSQVTFQVVDANNNPLPNQQVTLDLTTFAGGLLLQSGQTAVTQTTDSNGKVTAIINSGTVPTPVRVTAKLSTGISTVSNNLAVAVGSPSELNFSLAQTSRNIEGMNIDGTTNTYTVRAADRSGNPVPDGTAISFWSEIGGQISATATTSLTGGIATAKASFVSSGTRPADGRVTIVAYALGEESFVDLNGDNVYTPAMNGNPAEPYQDLGDIALDRLFDGVYDSTGTPNGGDQYVSLSGVASGTQACHDDSASYPQFAIGADIPNVSGTCSGTWSSHVYVRRATETVLSTSDARLLWASTTGLTSSCYRAELQTGPYLATNHGRFALVAGDTWHGGSAGVLSFYVADDNTYPGTSLDFSTVNSSTRSVKVNSTYPGNTVPVLGRLNPMAAGTTISVTGTSNLTVKVTGGSPVPSTSEATFASVSYEFSTGTTGTVTVNVTSPSGLTTTYGIPVVNDGGPTTSCPTN